MTTIADSKKERAFLLACAYCCILFVSTGVLWWSVLSGGNPLTFHGSDIVDNHGNVISDMKVGQTVGVKRTVCSTQRLGVEVFSSLQDKDGLIYPLQSGMFNLAKGCEVKIYSFVVPDIPPGEYIHRGTVRYQTNLVGRDEMTTAPEIRFRITP